MLKRVCFGMAVVLLLAGCGNVDDLIDKIKKTSETEEEVPVTEPKTQETEKKALVTEQEEVIEVPEESEEVDFAAFTDMETEVVDFPDWVPLPNNYIVIMDMDMGPMRQAVLETGDPDIRALVDRFNEELKALGAEEYLEEEDDEESEIFSATVSLNYDGMFVMITIGEYEPGGALQEGNTGSVSYMIY